MRKHEQTNEWISLMKAISASLDISYSVLGQG